MNDEDAILLSSDRVLICLDETKEHNTVHSRDRERERRCPSRNAFLFAYNSLSDFATCHTLICTSVFAQSLSTDYRKPAPIIFFYLKNFNGIINIYPKYIF